jgi:hypothetical protein
MNSIKLSENPITEYYIADEVKELNPIFFKGTAKTIRKIIEIKNIPETEYIYATISNNGWKACDVKCKKGKLLLTKSWCDANIIAMKENPVIENNNWEILPDLLYLENRYKFRDIRGNIIELEVRGERDRHKIFFKVSDISKGFELPNLNTVLLNKDKGYERDIHYKTFANQLDKKISLYLTYKGLLKVMFSNKNKNADKIQDWAEKNLFTIQFGDTEEKEVLAAELLDVNVKAIRQVFRSSSMSFPCIYLFELGKVKDLRDTFDISESVSNDLTVYKYGTTKDMNKRISQHQNDYGKLKNVNLKLKLFTYIDPKYNFEAETDLSDMFKGLNIKLDVNHRNELIAPTDIQYKIIESQYNMIHSKYSGCVKDIQEQLNTLRNQYKIDMMEKDSKIKEVEMQKEKAEIELKTQKELHARDLQIQQLMIQYKDLMIENLKAKCSN